MDAAGRLMAPDRELGLAVEPIVSALERARGARLERAALIGLLGRTGSPRAAAALIPEARGEDEYLRCIALEALGQLGPADADQVLIDALESPHFPTRWTAAIALRRVGRGMAIDPILKRFDEAASSRRETLAVALAGPLGDEPSDAQLARVVELLNLSRGPTKDALVEALAHVPNARGTALLQARLALYGNATRAKVAEALGGQPGARLTLLDLLKDTDAAVRANAVWSLGSAGLATDAGALSELLEDREISVAANSVAALALLASRLRLDVATHLCRAMDDQRSPVRANALAGLRLTASRCQSAERVTWLIEHDSSDEVRMAAARLIRDQPPWSSQLGPLTLERCAAKDRSGQVAAECARAPEATPIPTEPMEVGILVVPAGSGEPAARVPFSLVRADGLIRSGLSDRRGSVWEPKAPRGTLRLTTPSVFVE
jgi:HEAT repeat protein